MSKDTRELKLHMDQNKKKNKLEPQRLFSKHITPIMYVFRITHKI